jgi:hypothetical protein
MKHQFDNIKKSIMKPSFSKARDDSIINSLYEFINK